MTIEELICELEQYPPNAEVRILTDDRWPWVYTIGGVQAGDRPGEVHIAQGNQERYADTSTKEE